MNDSDEESISSSANKHNGMEDDDDDTSASSLQSDHGATPPVGSSQHRALQNGNNCEGYVQCIIASTPFLSKSQLLCIRITVINGGRHIKSVDIF